MFALKLRGQDNVGCDRIGCEALTYTWFVSKQLTRMRPRAETSDLQVPEIFSSHSQAILSQD